MIGAATPTVSPLAISRWNEARIVLSGLTVVRVPLIGVVEPSEATAVPLTVYLMP